MYISPLLCAKPKVGKSWMLLDMALAKAGGGCALELANKIKQMHAENPGLSMRKIGETLIPGEFPS